MYLEHHQRFLLLILLQSLVRRLIRLALNQARFHLLMQVLLINHLRGGHLNHRVQYHLLKLQLPLLFQVGLSLELHQRFLHLTLLQSLARR